MSETHDSWHLDKRVPVSMIAAMLVQLVAFVWFIAVMYGEIAANRTDIVRIDRSVHAIVGTSNGQAVQLGRIEEQVGALRSDIGRLVRTLEQRQ